MQCVSPNNSISVTANNRYAITTAHGDLLIYSGSKKEGEAKGNGKSLICCAWSRGGDALMAGSEDGYIRQYSSKGLLRSTLVSDCPNPIFALCWSPDGQEILYTNGTDLCLKPLTGNAKQTTWTAHEGAVLSVDWNPINNLIVSCGEDCQYKVWDSYARLLYQSPVLDYVVTSVKWSPSGEMFAVGTFNQLRLCDKAGWTYSGQKTDTGSIYRISWTSDGTQLAGAGGDGTVCFGNIVGRRLEWKNIEVVQNENNQIRVHDILNENVEEHEFQSRVVKMSLGHGYLIVATTSRLYIYGVEKSSDSVAELQSTVNLIIQSEANFLTVSNSQITVWTYEGREVGKLGYNTESLNENKVSLRSDAFAVVDPKDDKMVHVYDTKGKPIGNPIVASNVGIEEIALNQYGALNESRLVVIDKNRDLFITPIFKTKLVKLGTMVDTVMWNDDTDMLAAVMDQKFVVWYYPNVVYIDKELTSATRYSRDGTEFGKGSHFQTFFGTQCTVRRGDGAIVTSTVSPYPSMLYKLTWGKQWKKAVRMCRFVKDNELWACLAAMAIANNHLQTAEDAFAAIDEVDRLEFISHVNKVPSAAGKRAEMALYRGEIEEAESILLQAGLVYRAIDMNIRLYRWERALKLASDNGTHVDTVLGFRSKYLKRFKREETNQDFLKLKALEINWEDINAKIQFELQKETGEPISDFGGGNSSSSSSSSSSSGSGSSGFGPRNEQPVARNSPVTTTSSPSMASSSGTNMLDLSSDDDTDSDDDEDDVFGGVGGGDDDEVF
eukprot:TRINITY_DN2457_c0_g4_i3.p1 TRINITY_DN2457_c0_g4~~TRINITY_DN2457_c0_g4_i3.p1  ORF type:complete len:836 (+),score=299.28 TRINITY_DN2457_c0_g4_i3:177-2510(+)